ncbi:MAG: hypothetical protein Q9161_004292 [Pseudevernia consocians]
MVSLSLVQSSNTLISSTLPPNLVAVFVGATSGIGEATLKQFAKHARQPRAYFVGRSQDAGDRILAECKALNAKGEFIFIKADVSLIRIVDEVCEEIKAKEKAINILFLSAGVAVLDRRETSEHIHLLTALSYYSRTRFITNLIPLLQRASALRRVITVGKGGFEGPINPSDFPASRVPLRAIRGHICTLFSLGLESVAKTAPEVSFIHDDPGAVKTQLFERVEGIIGVLMRAFIFIFGYWVCVPIEECGERQLYLATSARYPPKSVGRDGGSGVPLGDGVDVARGTTDEVGSGVYSVKWDGTSASPEVQKLLAGYRDEGMVEKIKEHKESEFNRITK